MKIFKDDRHGRGYDFERNVHTENALKVFNVLQPHLSNAPEGSDSLQLFAFPLYAACAYYAQTTDDAGAEHFEKGIRIAIWAHTARCGASDADAKELTEFIFANILAIGILKTRGDSPLQALPETPTEDVRTWIEQGIGLAEGAAKAVGQRV